MSKFLFQWAFSLSALACLFAPGISVGCAQDDEKEELSLTIGSKAPAIDVEHWVSDGNGKFNPVKEFDSGKVYVVEFWATWCGPCVSSMPHLADTQSKYADKGVQIISVSDEDLDTVEGFLKKKIRGQKKAEAAEGEEGEKTEAKGPATYGELTSVYCLTTDPDGSVNADYMQAAGENGIPCCFIVGKSGLIEWIGHPMEMDEPLEKVVGGSWDRDAYILVRRKKQEREALIGEIVGMLQSGDSEEAMEAIEEARKNAAGDAELIAILDQLEVSSSVGAVVQKFQAGDAEEGVKDMDALIAKSKPEIQARLAGLKVQLLMQADEMELAATALKQFASVEKPDPQMLNEITWGIYEAAKDNEDFPKELLAAATVAAEKAVAEAPKDGMILDTLAHLVHMQGDLDRAIELQTEAVKNPGPQPDEITAFLEELKKEKAKGGK